MIVIALVAAAILLAPIAYLVFRKFSYTREQIEFGVPLDGVAAISLDIREDCVRRIRIVYQDGTMSEVSEIA